MVNVDLLTRTNDHIRKFPELHNQACYAEGVALSSIDWIGGGETEADLLAGDVCGTAFCFAGWAALLAGWHQTRDEESHVVDETGREESMCGAAAAALGLTPHQAAALFDGTNDRELIDRYVALLVANPDATRAQLAEVEEDYICDC